MQAQFDTLRKGKIFGRFIWFFVVIAFVRVTFKVGAQEQISSSAVLIDRSSSVDQNNRDEAIRLVEGLVTGEMPTEIQRKWHFLPSEEAEDDPELMAVRSRMEMELFRRLSSESSVPLMTPDYELLVGSLGDRKRVSELANANWFRPKGEFFGEVKEAASLSNKGDPTTFFKLARATLGNRLGGNRNEFLLFVISDGVEDLVNKSVAYYLDEGKLGNLQDLAKGDFRDDKTHNELSLLNAGRYTPADRKVLSDFEGKFAELQVGRFSLSAPELKGFFGRQGAKPKKVPVFIYVYRTLPREALEVRFTTPQGSSQSNPYIVHDDSRLGWRVTRKGKEVKPDTLTLTDMRTATTVAVAADRGGKISDYFDSLGRGVHELILKATHEGDTRSTNAFVSIAPGAPQIVFRDAFDGCHVADKACELSESAGLLETDIRWSWQFAESDLGPPDNLEWELLAYQVEDKYGEREPEFSLPGQFGTKQKKATLRELLVLDSEDDDVKQSPPLGGRLYKLVVTGFWPNGVVSQSGVAWFRLPPARLKIFGEKGTEAVPRKVSSDEPMKITNWMHHWEGFEYALVVKKRENDEWTRVEKREDWPIKLESYGGGKVIQVHKKVPKKLQYRVLFVPKGYPEDRWDDDDTIRNYPSAKGFLAPSGGSWLPWLIGALAVLSLSFLGWNLFVRKH